jgi:uncharacterized RDD family membrane protein YckC
MQYQSEGRFCQNCGSPARLDALICPVCKQHYPSPAGTIAASYGVRFGAWIADLILVPITLGIGWLIWALFTFRNGQTPGKSLVNIRVVRDTGAPSEWGWTFVREILIKRIALPLASAFTFGILNLLNYLWPLWDPNVQALHDKIVSTVVVRQSAPSARIYRSEPGDAWGAGQSAPPPAGGQDGAPRN